MAEQEEPRRVVVCQGLFCSARGAGALLRVLETRLAGVPGVVVERQYCFNGCSHGPNVVLYPERCWYEGIGPADVDALVAHAATGEAGRRPPGARIPAVVKETAHAALAQRFGVAPAAEASGDADERVSH